jgi:hypothetical protein
VWIRADIALNLSGYAAFACQRLPGASFCLQTHAFNIMDLARTAWPPACLKKRVGSSEAVPACGGSSTAENAICVAKNRVSNFQLFTKVKADYISSYVELFAIIIDEG